jgi:hypothetical protein
MRGFLGRVFGRRVRLGCVLQSFGRMLVSRFTISFAEVFRGVPMASGRSFVQRCCRNMFFSCHGRAPSYLSLYWLLASVMGAGITQTGALPLFSFNNHHLSDLVK